MTVSSALPDIDSLWDYNNPFATESRFRALLPLAETIDPAYHVTLLTQIARAQGLQRRFDNAHATLDQAQSLITEAMAVPRVRLWLERGRVYRSARNVTRARPLFLAAWDLARACGGDALAVDAAHMLGLIEAGVEGLAWNERALEIARVSSDSAARRWAASLLNNLGWAYHDLGQYETALDYFQQALTEREAQGDPESIRVARWCLARGLRSLGRVDEALALQQSLAALEKQDGYVDEEIGECLVALGRADEARPYFARAYAALSQDPWLAEREPDRLRRMQSLASGNIAESGSPGA